MPRTRDGRGPDYRMVLPAGAAWATAALAVVMAPRWSLISAAALSVAAILLLRWHRNLLAATCLVIAAVSMVTAVRMAAVSGGPVPDLADDGAVVHATLTITSDPRTVATSYDDLVVVHARITEVTGRGGQADVASPVVVFADEDWLEVELGSSVETTGRLGPPDDTSKAAVLDAGAVTQVRSEPAWWWRAAAGMRAAVTESVSQRSTHVAALVPALVHGDDQAIPDDLDEAFKAAGLTHLLAVSGTNLTIVVGFLLVIGRGFRLRTRGQLVLGLAGTVAFVVLARPEPSVVRAAGMGIVALAGLGAGGRSRGVRALAWAVIGLVLIDPWLSRSAGFVLSVCATAGILFLAPGWRDALARWMPTACAEAIAIPLAAQLACTPVVAAISSQVSLVSVVANLLVAPAVAPATVLGLAGGAVTLISEPLGHVVGYATGLFAGWIAAIGVRAADLPGAAIEWSATPAALIALTLLCLVMVLCLRTVLSRPLIFVCAAALSVVLVIRPVSIGWPPDDWVMVMCDVGQGDAAVLNAGDGTAVVVDAGPTPRAVDGCLRRLGIDAVAMAVITHAHLDHYGGLEGVLRDREVASVGISAAGPEVTGELPATRLELGRSYAAGDVGWTVLGPPVGTSAATGEEGEEVEGSDANNASVVMLAEVRGVRILLTGDIEPEAQAELLRSAPNLDADILKVPHHGSSSQDPELFETVDGAYAVIGVGDNDYGHPSPKTLDLIEDNQMTVTRTDLDGDVAFVLRDGDLTAVTR